MKKIAINGLGRIGRMVLRHYLSHPSDEISIVAANDLVPIDDLAYLLRYDSVHGQAQFPVKAGPDYIQLGSGQLKITSEKNPQNLPWKSLGVDVVLECTGRFRRREDAALHLKAGAKKVIVSAPADSADLTVVLGVNQDRYDAAKHHIVSNASCTTNSLAPAVWVLHQAFGIEYLMVTTVHAYTASQALVDQAARKKRRGRAAALVIPELKGKMDAIAVRVPVPDGALTDIVAHLKKDVSVESVNAAFKQAAGGKLKGILDYREDEIVSADIIGDPHSGIVDASSTRVILNRVAKVLVWYDNEYGYSKRLLELAEFIGQSL